MSETANPDQKCHVLLVGIDDYAKKPLRGCVNDIDAVQRLLLGKQGRVPKESVRRLVSPRPGATYDTSVPGEPATLANLRAALAQLGSAKVAPGDRVFLYYSGHGTRALVSAGGGRAFHREALVPVDVGAEPGEPQLLYDFELNRLLAAIAARTRSVTFVLDCCHSAGATRDPGRADMVSRWFDLKADLKHIGAVPLSPEAARAAEDEPLGLAGSVDDCVVVSACLNHQLAYEADGPSGARHGLLTRALSAAVEGAAGADLRALPWGRLWQAMRADIERENPWQHPWMAGNAARAVLAGPPCDGDIGLAVVRAGENVYHLDAGTLADVTEGAKIVLYDEKPPLFPELDSEADHKARLPYPPLRVTSAERSSALAVAEGPPFDPPPGARGRLVEPGSPNRLRCAIDSTDEALAKPLRASPLLEVTKAALAQAWLERRGDVWALVDDVHGAKEGSPVLFKLQTGQLDRARALLEHYYYYALPLRMAARCTDLQGALKLALLACPKDRNLNPAEAQEADLPEAAAGRDFPYDLTAGDRVCIRVRNDENEPLRVTLLNSAASGKVQLLGDLVIGPRASHVFWARSVLGSPFTISPPKGAAQSVDRMTAIGTTATSKDLSYLRLDKTFAEIVNRTRGESKDFDDDAVTSPPTEQWTATQVIIRTRQSG